MPQTGVFSLRIAPIALSLYFCTKGIIIRMVPKGLNAFGSFAHAAEIAPDKNFLTFLRPLRMPQNGFFFHLIEKIADFLHNKLFFLIAPRDLHYYSASAQPCEDRLRR